MFVVFTRRRLLVIFTGLLLTFALVGRWEACGICDKIGNTHKQRTEFAASLGLNIADKTAESKETVLPDTFNAVYDNYNALQRKAGYDLSAYGGCRVTVYTYELGKTELDGEEAVLNLIVCNGKIIGGDISSRALDGFMVPLLENGEWKNYGKTTS